MGKKFSVPIIWTSALSMLSFFGLLKVIDTKESWKIVCATIGLLGFLTLLILVLIQMIKEKKSKDV